MSARIIRISIRLGLAVVAGTAVMPANAASADMVTQSANVRYRDLDLTAAADVATLQLRLRHAARSVCGAADMRDLAAMGQLRSCRTAALRTADARVQVAVAQARIGAQLATNAAGVPARLGK